VVLLLAPLAVIISIEIVFLHTAIDAAFHTALNLSE
jgi:hypothetical protein